MGDFEAAKLAIPSSSGLVSDNCQLADAHAIAEMTLELQETRDKFQIIQEDFNISIVRMTSTGADVGNNTGNRAEPSLLRKAPLYTH